jgi:hypothetical protein
MNANFKQTRRVPDWILWLLAVGLMFTLGAVLIIAGILDGTPPSDSEPAAAVPTETTPQPTATVEPTPEPTATVEVTMEPTATVEPTPVPTATLEPTPESTATVEPTPEPTSTPEPVEPTPTPKPPEPTPTPQPTVVPEPTATPEPKRNETPWLDWTFVISHPIYMPEIGEVVELHTGGKIMIHEITRLEDSETELSRSLGPDESMILIDVQVWNPADPTAPSISTILTIELIYGENVYGENVVWFLHPVREERVTGGPAYTDPTEPGQSVRGWMGVVVPSESSLHAIVWIIYDVEGDNDAIIVWLLDPEL